MDAWNNMESEKSKTKRIVKNTLFLYVRMILVMFVSFYTSRIVLDALGVVDFGIYGVVGGMTSMFIFFLGSLSNVSQRCLNIALEKNDLEQTKNTFCTHQSLYIIFSIFVLIVAEIVGMYFLKVKLVIPAERMTAAFWTFQICVLSLVVSLLSVVYDAVIIAHENMKIYSYVGIYEAFAKLSVAFLILTDRFDRLILYSSLLLGVAISIRIFYSVYCRRKYAECVFSFMLHRRNVKESCSLIGWNVVGDAMFIITNQGLNVLLNMFFGPAVNAAKEIATQVGRNVYKFSLNFTTAIQPQIIKSYASGDFKYLLKLFYGSSKYSFFLLWFFCLPLFFCMDDILGIWLKKVPENASLFAILILIYYLICVFSRPIWSIAIAAGKLKKYVCVGCGVLLLALPVSYFCLKKGCAPESVLIVNDVMRSVYVLLGLFVVRQYVPISFKHYFQYVTLPIALIVGISFLALFSLNNVIEKNFIGVCFLGISSFFINILCIFFIGLNSNERKTLVLFIREKMGKCKGPV